jgi:hypothetical protein
MFRRIAAEHRIPNAGRKGEHKTFIGELLSGYQGNPDRQTGPPN